MRLIRRLIELAFVIFILSLFMKNKDIVMQVNYYGLSAPITVAFWELVTFCVSLGIIVAAVGDFITQFKWAAERRHMVKRDSEHQQVVDRLNQRIEQLEAENKKLEVHPAGMPQDVSPLGRTEASTAEARLSQAGQFQDAAISKDKSPSDVR